MAVYVKFIDERKIEHPPTNKDGIINYNLDIERLITDGYKKLEQEENPKTDRFFEMLYREEETKIVYYVHWLETEEDYTKRKLIEVKVAKQNENELSCKAKLSSGTFKITVDGITASYLYNDNTKADLNSSAIGFIAGVLTKKQWTDEDGNTVMLSQENVAEMLLTLESWGNPIWDKWGIYKKQIDAATTIEEVEAIIIDYNEEIDYNKFTVPQLKVIADEKGINYPSNVLKADLIKLIKGEE